MELLVSGKGAEFSECGKYRYKLWRIWDETKPKAMCIGLNPSTANAEKNDNTINILIRVLRKLGYGGFYMMNLFAIISSKPEVILTCDDPFKNNGYHLHNVAALCETVIFCWGGFKEAELTAKEVEKTFAEAKCFGKNANGTPWHPRALSYKGLLDKPELIKF